MGSPHEVIVDEQPIGPDRLLAHESLYVQAEALGSRSGLAHIRRGGISFGRLDVVPVRSADGLASRGVSFGTDRIYVLIRFPFNLDQLSDGWRYLRVDLMVAMADADAVAHSIWPALATNDREADRARAFTINADLTLASAAGLPVTGPSAPVIRYLDLHPSIVGSGNGMPLFSWTLEPADGYPLIPAGRTVFAVLNLPADTSTVVGTLLAKAEMNRPILGVFGRAESRTRYLPFTVGVPKETRAATSAAILSRPVVFISYAYDSDEHVRKVTEFANFLARHGFDVVFDQWSDGQRLDWPGWMIDQMTRADFVIAVASAAYRRVGDAVGPYDAHRGAQAETSLMRELQYRDRGTWTPRLLPVVLPGHNLDEVPLFLHPYTGSNYVITEISVAGTAGLLRVLAGRSTLPRPDVPDE